MPYNQLKQTGSHLHETEKNQGKQSFFSQNTGHKRS